MKFPFFSSIFLIIIGIYSINTDKTIYEGGIQCLILGIILLVVMLWIFFEQLDYESFTEKAIENKDALIKGGSFDWGEKKITKDTQIINYEWAISLVILCYKYKTSIQIEKTSIVRKILCSFITFIFGWWGIPWGPVFTIQVLIGNLSGGQKMTVGRLIELAEQGKSN